MRGTDERRLPSEQTRAFAWVEDHALYVGDRVRIRPNRRPLPGAAEQAGTVVQRIGMPRDSYLVRVDGDTEQSRVWFFYRAEILAEEAAAYSW